MYIIYIYRNIDIDIDMHNPAGNGGLLYCAVGFMI